MANHAYLRVWTRDFSESTMIPEFARFLTTAPLSPTKPGFTELIVQAIDSTEIVGGGMGLDGSRQRASGGFGAGDPESECGHRLSSLPRNGICGASTWRR